MSAPLLVRGLPESRPSPARLSSEGPAGRPPEGGRADAGARRLGQFLQGGWLCGACLSQPPLCLKAQQAVTQLSGRGTENKASSLPLHKHPSARAQTRVSVCGGGR